MSSDSDDSSDDFTSVKAKRPCLDEHYDLPESFGKDDSENDETRNENGRAPKSSSLYSSGSKFGKKILEKYGHKPGRGLGKHEQGIVEPVKVSDQKGTRGLGFQPKKIEYEVDPESEGISVEEKVYWLDNNSDCITSLKGWMEEGCKKKFIDDETEFCDPEILDKIISTKKKFDNIDKNTFLQSRCRANPFESIRAGIFINRAAMKMANMDAVFDYMFTEPKDKQGNKIIRDDELLYFADVCAGPGGFSEYVFYRKKWRAKGFGFTLKGSNDFRLEDFFAGPSETFQPHYGEDDDGDIYKPHNIKSFTSFVMSNTEGIGVHFMMADGGFCVIEKSDSGLVKKDEQELESKQLYLCQCLVALKIVRPGGNFVVKFFDIFTPFSVGLIYLMYRSFERIAIHKPNSSRPANSERYLICQYKRGDCEQVTNYLFSCCELLYKWRKSERDITMLVPRRVYQEDKTFVDYITNSNNRIGQRQIHHLNNVIYYCQDKPDASDERQSMLKEECLKYWKVDNMARTEKGTVSPDTKVKGLLKHGSDFLYKKPTTVFDLSTIEENAKNNLDWYWVVTASGEESEALTFYLGLGRSNIYRLVGKVWKKVTQYTFHLPEGTLIYGEIAEETKCTDKVTGQYRVTVLHIIDGLFLGGEDISNLHITRRKKCCELFVKALSNPNIRYRTKNLYRFRDIKTILPPSLKYRKIKNKNNSLCYDVEDEEFFFVPRGLLFFCGTNDKCSLNFSKTFSKYYYNCSSKNASHWSEDVFSGDRGSEFQKFFFANFKTTFEKRFAWWLSEEDLRFWLNNKDSSLD